MLKDRLLVLTSNTPIHTHVYTQTFTYITVSAVDAGVDVGFSYNLVAIINAASAPGQLVGGLLADRYGVSHPPSPSPPWRYRNEYPTNVTLLLSDPVDVLIYSTLLAALVNVAWPFATHAAGIRKPAFALRALRATEAVHSVALSSAQ